MERKFQFSPGEYYHVYNRGTDKRKIFLNKKDYERFQALLYVANDTAPVHFGNQGRTSVGVFNMPRKSPLVSIGAYCLMPNHFHILIHETKEGGISTFMQKLSTAYSMYFNKKYERTGALFEGKFKAQHVTDDTYLEYLFSYIHLNPVKLIDPKWTEGGVIDKEEVKKYLFSYAYSSYLDLLKKFERSASVVLDLETFPDYFNKPKDFEEFINQWLSIKDEHTL